MDNTKNLRIVFTGDTASVVAAFDAVQNKSRQTQEKVGSFSQTLDNLGTKAQQVGGQMSSLGATMTAGFTLPIVGIGIASAKMAMDFQQAMTYVRTDAGDTTDDINKLSQSVLDLAKTSQFTPDQLANGLYHLASLGLRGADAMNALDTAQKMAAVGGADLESTASALGAALVTGIRGVQDYSSAAGVLDATIGAGNMRMQDLVNALGTGVLPVFKNAGLSITDFGAALATLTDNGMGADEAATRLKMTISLMEAPSKKAQGALAAIGMTSNQLGMDMQTKGLIPALQDLNQHLLDTYGTTAAGRQQMAQALTEMFGGGRSSAAIQTLLDQIDRVQNKFNQIGEQTGEFSDKVAQQQETAAARVKTAWSNIQVDMIELGSKVLPMLADDFTALTKDVSGLIKWWDGLTEAQQHDIETIGKILIVTGPLLSVFGKLASTFGTIMRLGSFGAGIFGNLFGGLMGASSSAAGLAGLGAEAGAASEAAVGLGTILTGPVGIAILGTVAAAGLAYLAYKKWTDDGIKPAQKELSSFNKLANDLGYTVTGTASKVDLLTLAQTHEKDAANMLDEAGKRVDATHKQQADAAQTVKTLYDDLATSQDNYTAAVQKFGQNSPQAAAAQQDLTDKQDAYNNALAAATKLQLDNIINEGNLKDAIKIHNAAVQDMTGVENYYNDALKGTVGVIAEIGPTALLQVAPLGTLATNIASVAGAWKDFTLQVQNSAVNTILFGTQSTIQRLQGQVTGLNQSLSAANNSAIRLGGNVSGVNLQGGSSPQHNASGTDYFQGGDTWINEDGPELVRLPRGSQILNAKETQQVTNHRNITIGTIVLGSADAVKEMFSQLDRDNLLVMKGLSPARGL